MNGDWQTWAAIAVVGATAGAFVWRAVTRKKKGAAGCPSCGPGEKRPVQPHIRRG